MAGGSASASASGPALELAALLLNITLGAFDAGLFDETAAPTVPAGSGAALAALADDMRAGSVEVLHRRRREPGLRRAGRRSNFAEALAKVPLIVSLERPARRDRRCSPTCSRPPATRSSAGAMPRCRRASSPSSSRSIQPLFDTRGLLDVLVDWAAALGDPAGARGRGTAATAPTPAPLPATAAPAPSPSLAWHYLRAAWATAWRWIRRRRPSRPPGTTCCAPGWWQGARAGRRRRARCAGSACALLGAPAGARLRASSCSSIRTSRSPTAARATTAGCTSCPIRSRASPGAARSRSRRAASTR